jgi:CheY-like chemotaxis protein
MAPRSRSIFPPWFPRRGKGKRYRVPWHEGGAATILLVDDEEFIRDLGSRILEKAGYKVITAANGKEALETYEREQDEIALVLLNLLMPEMVGKECLEKLFETA